MTFFNDWKNTKGLVPLVIYLLTASLSTQRSSLSLSKHFSQLLAMAVGCQIGVSPQLVDLLSPELIGSP